LLSRIRITIFFTHPGSRGQKGPGSAKLLFHFFFIRQLNKMLPLPSLQHLKRVKSYRDPRDGPRILLLLWQLEDDKARIGQNFFCSVWGSVTCWWGSGSADPYLWLTDSAPVPTPYPTPFFSD
jgi:hypothetical protein